MLQVTSLENGKPVLLLHERQLLLHSVSSSLQGLHKAGLMSLQTLVYFAVLCVLHLEEPGQALAGVVPGCLPVPVSKTG